MKRMDVRLARARRESALARAEIKEPTDRPTPPSPEEIERARLEGRVTVVPPKRRR